MVRHSTAKTFAVLPPLKVQPLLPTKLSRKPLVSMLCVCTAVYESEEYYRAAVQPVLPDGQAVAADVYIWKDQFRWAQTISRYLPHAFNSTVEIGMMFTHELVHCWYLVL